MAVWQALVQLSKLLPLASSQVSTPQSVMPLPQMPIWHIDEFTVQSGLQLTLPYGAAKNEQPLS